MNTVLTHPLQQILDRVAYKPGWEFEVDGVADWHWWITVNIQCIDSYNPDREIVVSHHRAIPSPRAMPEAEWVRYLFHLIVDIEKHEAGEFFRIDGKRPFEPEHGVA